MSEKSKKESKPQCPVPENVRKAITDTADIVEKHKEVVRKLNPFSLKFLQLQRYEEDHTGEYEPIDYHSLELIFEADSTSQSVIQ